MYRLNIVDEEILENVSDFSVYARGVNYYQKGRVTNLYFDEDEMVLEADVLGSEEYRVWVEFYPDGSVGECHCDCPAFYEYEGICKHIVAVLKAAQAALGKGNNIDGYGKKSLEVFSNKEIFDFFEAIYASVPLKEVKLDVVLEIDHGYKRKFYSMELRIGEDRLYVVKSIKDFIESIQQKRIITFGKNFTFNPGEHYFSEIDKKIIKLAAELYENEQTTMAINPCSYTSGSSFKGKKLYISDAVLMRLLEILKDETFTLRFGDREIKGVNIIDGDIPVKFRLHGKGDNLALKMDIKGLLYPLTRGGEYFLHEDSIYKPSQKQKQSFIPFFNSIIVNQQKELIFSSNEKERFVSEVLPYLNDAGEVYIDPNLEQNFYQQELTSKVYFDKLDAGISARIEFCYGEEVMDPFLPRKENSSNERIIIRDVEKERTIIRLLENAEFKIMKDKVYLEDEEKIFYFLKDVLPELQKLSEVYYSDDFKRITIRDPRSFTGRVRLNEKSALLEFSFGFKGVDRDELENLFNSIKEKKKYHRLKDGSFIPLESPEIIEVSELLEHLNISDSDLKNEILELPKEEKRNDRSGDSAR